MNRVEVVPDGRAIWQRDNAKTYQCPYCFRPVYTQYEGDVSPMIECLGIGKGHRVTWPEVH